MPSQALVFAAAPVGPTPRLLAHVAQLDITLVVAADRGAATALAFGVVPALVIGDLDSIAPATLAQLQSRGVPVEAYPRDKDQIDGELAIQRTIALGADELYLIGFLGGPRLDMTLASAFLLTRFDARITLLDARNEITLLRPNAALEWTPEPDEVVSLLPLIDAHVTTHGLRWPLRGDLLRIGETRGLSNEPVSKLVRVEIEGGPLLLTRHFGV